jgi:hypothetical protein
MNMLSNFFENFDININDVIEFFLVVNFHHLQTQKDTINMNKIHKFLFFQRPKFCNGFENI